MSTDTLRTAGTRRNSVGRETLIGIFLLLLPVIGAQAGGGAGYFYYVAAQLAVWATFAIAYDLLIGFAGITSFGHATFFGIGAYGAAISFLRIGETFSSLLIGFAAAAVAGALIGFGIIRTFGVAILLLTFALGQAMWLIILANPWGLTGGDNGLPGLQPPHLFGAGSEVSLYLIAAAMFLVSFRALRALTNSPFGDVLKGIRENEQRVACLGFNTRAYKLAAFVISAAVSGLAGAVNAFTQRQASPDVFYWLVSTDVMVFALLGGRGTLIGPAIAAGALILIRTALSAYTDSWQAVVGVIYVVSALLLPNGVWTALRERIARGKTKSNQQ